MLKRGGHALPFHSAASIGEGDHVPGVDFILAYVDHDARYVSDRRKGVGLVGEIRKPYLVSDAEFSYYLHISYTFYPRY